MVDDRERPDEEGRGFKIGVPFVGGIGEVREGCKGRGEDLV